MVANIRNIELPFFVAHLRIKYDVKEQVSELLAYFRMFILQNGVAQLIHFLNRLRPQTLVCLFAVPRTFFSQFVKNVEQPSEGFEFLFSCVHIIRFISL